MKKIQVLIYALSIICIICSLFLIKQKRDYDLLKKDVDSYINEINSLENEISNYESKKEQVKEELVSNLDENKKKEYEVWKVQNNYLNEHMK